ncbi:hypothetical protein [Asticcacaulis tiandongensis]|uniref:hypothetical protein n=1 Tax=Asticcacaulis tiandongensis TaxID=2565365 RepID=UPI00112E2146|nr:hypothetical protein [Asticcacaulis tiandongensis]
MAAHRSDPYPFDNLDDSAIDDTMLLDLFQSAYEAYGHKMAHDGVTIGQRVGFDVYDRLCFDAHNKITSPRRARYELSQHGPKDHHQTFHLDRRLFISCLTRRMSWNEGVPLCLYDRQPNIFMPTVDFSLNYLVAPTEKLIDLNLSQQSPPPA